MARAWPDFERTGPAAAVGDVDAFEKQSGVSLPTDSYDFLIEVSGGRLGRSNFERRFCMGPILTENTWGNGILVCLARS